MRICIIGKFPPIQGGVSMRTYWTAHALAARGHDIHVVTNAKEVRPPFRMHMRARDWERCEPKFATGSVTVHWTDPVDRSQSYIPMASPFVSKLASVAANVHSAHAFDVIFSHYMEPYGIAGHLAAQLTGAPHVVRMAGSDAGRLWHHPQFEALYDHVLRSAAAVVVTGTVAGRAVHRGVDAARVVSGGAYALPQDLFQPDGAPLDLAALRAELDADPELQGTMWGGYTGDRPCLGVYGKLGARKGTFALLAAMHRLKLGGVEVGLLALAHGSGEVEQQFRDRATELGLAERVLQIPFLPHWRVPEFLRSCLAVCCLEQDFPIGFHNPIIPREVLLCGACLVGSSEVIRKLPDWRQLPHGYGCVAVEDVDDIATLAARLGAVLRDPQPAAIVGVRGRAFALELERDIDFPGRIQRILTAAADQRTPLKSISINTDRAKLEARSFALTQIAAAALVDAVHAPDVRPTIDLPRARKILARLERAIADGELRLRSLSLGVQVEIAVAAAERDADKANGTKRSDPLFRLQTARWGFIDGDLAGLIPIRDSRLRMLRFEFDVAAFRDVRVAADLPAVVGAGQSHLVVFGRSGEERRDPVLIDGFTAQVLELSDGTRTAGEIVTALHDPSDKTAREHDLKWIEHLFVDGLIRLRNNVKSGQKPLRQQGIATRAIAR